MSERERESTHTPDHTHLSLELSDFEDFSAYEVADFIKLYCRELPEAVLTTRLSEILLLVQESKWARPHSL